VRIAFLIPRVSLAGGIFVVLEHASRLSKEHGFDVTLVQTHGDWIDYNYPSLAGLELATIDDVAGRQFDIALATWWETLYFLPRIEAQVYVHFVQSLEDRFYLPEEVDARVRSGAIQSLPIARIVIAGWLERYFSQLLPGVPVRCVRNGIDKSVFFGGPPEFVSRDRPLRIVVEGPPDVWFKSVPEAVEAVAQMSEHRHLTLVTASSNCPSSLLDQADEVKQGLSHREMANLFRQSHVLLKLSRVEGMAGPPLEAFHAGATAILTPVTGSDEYVVHGFNSIVVGYDDIQGTTRALDLLARDRDLLHTLRTNALETASGWRDWATASREMAVVMHEMLNERWTYGAQALRQLILEADTAFSAQGDAGTLRAERDALHASLVTVMNSRGWLALERARRLMPWATRRTR
jgi:glycosyltransferase involved in cell wall biosynthesis